MSIMLGTMLRTSPLLRAPLLGAILCLLAPAWAVAADLDDFYGSWRTESLDAQGDGGIEVAADLLDLDVRPAEGDGFRARWTLMEAESAGTTRPRRVEALFTPTDRPNVFAFRQEKGSFLSRFFASPETGNPLEQEVLLWARLDEDRLILYSLTVAETGDPVLSHAAHRLEDGGLAVERIFRNGPGAPFVVEGRLERVER